MNRRPQAGNQWEDFVTKAALAGVDESIKNLASELAQALQERKITVDDFLDRMYRARGARRACRKRLLSVSNDPSTPNTEGA